MTHSPPNKKHGQARTTAHTATPEYKAWCAMKDRCCNPKSKGYPRYGARGVCVCGRWMESFENFFADMGSRPDSSYSLDRKENSGDYEPGNCRWASPQEQARNRRNNHKLTLEGQTLPLIVWAEKFGINKRTLLKRLRKGMSPAEALASPIAVEKRRTA